MTLRVKTPRDVVLRTEGQRRLLQIPGTLQELAAQCGSQTSSVHGWKTGAKNPNAKARAALKAAFGIPVRTWTVRPAASAPPLPASSAAAPATWPEPPASSAATWQEPPAPPPARGTPPAVVVPPSGGTTLEDCHTLLQVIRQDRDREDLVPSERTKLVDSEAKILALRARLEEAAKFAESSYVMKHPAWLRLKRLILKALESHPDAARAVAEAIVSAESE